MHSSVARRVLLFGLWSAILLAQGPKTQITIIEAVPSRREGEIRVSVSYRNSGDRPVEGLLLVVSFLDTSNRVLTARNAPIEEPVLPVGDEGSIEAYIHDTPKAVAIRISAEDRRGREVRIENRAPTQSLKLAGALAFRPLAMRRLSSVADPDASHHSPGSNAFRSHRLTRR